MAKRWIHFIAPLLGAGLVVSLAGSASASPKSFVAPPAYYLALGDSLAAGVQPDANGNSVITDQGYANDLFAIESANIPRLHLVNLGCPGETTTTMINGGICQYNEGSQLAEAAHFIRHHRSTLQFVTIDIGANDVDGCVSGLVVDIPCVKAALQTIGTNLPAILETLKLAGGLHVPEVIGVKYYDPYLALYLTGPSGQDLAHLSVLLSNVLNEILRQAYKADGAKVANVAFAFQTNDFTDTVDLPPFGTIPVNVANICQWTWMCAPPPVGPNIHANAAGYEVMAEVIAAVL